MKRFAMLLNLRTTAAILLLCLASSTGTLGAEPPGAAHLAPYRAPNFSRANLNGKMIRLSDFKGKVVLLNFWATWCEPCLAEMPKFAEWQSEYRARGLQVVGISMDDAEPVVRKAVSRLSLNYPVVMGDEKIGAAYGGILGLPITMLIDRQGFVRARYEEGADFPKIERDLGRLLQ